jgi:hypothetical protein
LDWSIDNLIMIISIAPRLPPAACGVGAYSLQLAEAWPSSENFVHLVVDGELASCASLPNTTIVGVGHSSSRLTRELISREPVFVILHYSGRGYHRYGIPIWLAKAIKEWKKKRATVSLIVFFHEVPAHLPLRSIRNHHGVIQKANQYIMGILCRYASCVVTNSPEHAMRLESMFGLNNVACISVSSTIPSPIDSVILFENRIPTDFLIFGLPFTQLITLKTFSEELAHWASAGILRRLHLVGPNDSSSFSNEINVLLSSIVSSQEVVRHGLIKASDLSKLLQTIGFCLTPVTEKNYFKSTTFMAYAAHGCPIISGISGTSLPFKFLVQPNEVEGRPYVDFEPRVSELRDWYYREADWPLAVTKIATSLRSNQH